jgi:hypothetical protein
VCPLSKTRQRLAPITNTQSKLLLNTATQELEELLNTNKNACIQIFLQGLTPTESTDYSLWKVTKKLNRPKNFYTTHKERGQEAT